MSGEHASERADHFDQRTIPGLIRHVTRIIDRPAELMLS